MMLCRTVLTRPMPHNPDACLNGTSDRSTSIVRNQFGPCSLSTRTAVTSAFLFAAAADSRCSRTLTAVPVEAAAAVASACAAPAASISSRACSAAR